MIREVIKRLTDDERNDIINKLKQLLLIMTYATDPKVREAALHTFLHLLQILKDNGETAKEVVKIVGKHCAPAVKAVLKHGIKFIV